MIEISNEFIIGAIVLLVVLYLLCNHVEQYVSQKSLENNLYNMINHEQVTKNGERYVTDKKDQYVTKNGERYLVKNGDQYIVKNHKGDGERYLVDNKIGEKYLVSKDGERYLVGNTREGYVTDEQIHAKKQEMFEERYVVENRDLNGSITNEHFGSNPLDQLTDADFTHGDFSSHNMDI